MADQEHLTTLFKGVASWNSWKSANKDVKIDLSGIEIKDLDLSYVDLSEVNLTGAKFENVVLDHSLLEKTDLQFANLTNVSMVSARLIGSNLTHAVLNRIDWTKAQLELPFLKGALLEEIILDHAYIDSYFNEHCQIRNSNFTAHVDLTNFRMNYVTFDHVDLSGVNLSGRGGFHCSFYFCDLSRADLSDCDFSEITLYDTSFEKANLVNCNLSDSNQSGVNYSGANLQGVNLSGSKLFNSNLNDANLYAANLKRTSIIETSVVNTNFDKAMVYGVSVWNLEGDAGSENDLVITRDEESPLMVDNLKVAQFIYLILNNQEIRNVINTVADKGVLILGRFSEERKEVLDALKASLREHGFVPILFDFQPSLKRNLTETVQLLANMSRFIVADLTDAKSIPQELSHIVPNLPSIPVLPIILENHDPYAMFEHWKSAPNVLPLQYYTDSIHLVESCESLVLHPVQNWFQQIEKDQIAETLLKAKEEELQSQRDQLKSQQELILKMQQQLEQFMKKG